MHGLPRQFLQISQSVSRLPRRRGERRVSLQWSAQSTKQEVRLGVRGYGAASFPASAAAQDCVAALGVALIIHLCVCVTFMARHEAHTCWDSTLGGLHIMSYLLDVC